jgi:hypothetical protein
MELDGSSPCSQEPALNQTKHIVSLLTNVNRPKLRREITTVYWETSEPVFHTVTTGYFFIFSFMGWGETESTWYCGHYWPIVPAPDDRRWWLWSSRWNETWQRKQKYSEKTYTSTTLSITNTTWPELGSNPDSRGGKPATNRLSYGTLNHWVRILTCKVTSSSYSKSKCKMKVKCKF